MTDLWPRWWANAITVVLFILIAASVFLIRRAAIMRTAPDQAAWRDIRLWAVLLITVQLALYVLFS